MKRRDFVLGAAFRAFAQEPTFSTDVKVVTLLATVHDGSGAIVTNLNQEDFLVEEAGLPQTIRYFSRESDLPLTIGLLVDTSRSQIGVLKRERAASYTFLDQVLREEKDQAFVAHFDIRVEVLQDLASSRTKLASALDKLAIPKRPATLLYQAVRECSESRMRKQQGRKAFVILSDGVDVRSKATIVTAIEYAQRRQSSRQFTAREASAPCSGWRGKPAERISRFPRKTRLRRSTRQSKSNYAIQYSIGYTPDRKDAEQRYRQIRLTARQPGLVVQTRAGYYAERDATRSKMSP